MNTMKSLLAVSVLAAAAGSANATVYSISGVETGITNTASYLVLIPFGTPHSGVTASTYGAAITVQPALTGSLDISGTTINGGSFSLGQGAIATFLGSAFTTMDTSAATVSFTGSTTPYLEWSSTGSVVAGTCTDGTKKGATAALVCPSAYAGSPAMDYILTDNGVTAGTHNWQLDLRLGTTDPLVTGGLTVQSYTFSAPEPAAVPVPAAAWLFGSGLLGLAGTARRRRTA